MPSQFNNSLIKKVLKLRGMVIDAIEISEINKTITIHLNRDKRFKKSYCSYCGQHCPRESRTRRIIRDLPILEYDVYLNCEIFTVKCSRCNARIRERLDFVDKCSRLTIRFEAFIFDLVSMTTLTNIANKYHLSWETVKDIDKKYLAGRLTNIDYGNLKYLSIDEISNKKGQDYLTIVMNLETGRVIWVTEGRKKEDLDRFFAKLTPEQKENIRAVCMDMWPAYIASVTEHCPNADIVFDKFHIIKKFGEVIIKLRSAEYQKAADEQSKEVLKGTKWLLLRNKSNLDKDGKKQLNQLLDLNENLAKAYILKEDLKQLWNYKHKAWAKKFLNNWITMAEESGIRGIKSFVKMLKKHEQGILNHCQHPIDNGKIEGTNNKIKTLKRMSYGFHDVEYFKLKILWTCRGKEKL